MSFSESLSATSSNPSPQHRFWGAKTRLVLSAALVALISSTAATAAPKPAQIYLVAVQPVPAPSGGVDLCRKYSWACASQRKTQTDPATVLRIAKAVNRSINAKVHAVSDRQQYGRDDVWALPTARGGDCEDYVLAKKKRLIEAGLSPETLLIATVLDRSRNSHAVLVLRTAAGDYVLDNLTSAIKPWAKTGYSFIRMQNPKAPRQWDAIMAGGIFQG